MVDNQDLGNWVGVYQNKITQNTNANKTASQTRIAYLKAGSIVQTVQDLIIPDLTVDLGKAAVLSYQTVPNPAYVENVTWTSSDPNVAKIIGNGLLAMHTGVATVTATEQASGVSKTFNVTVQQPTHSWNSQAISSSDLALVLTSSYRPELSYNYDQIMTTFPDLANYSDMDDTSFIQAVQSASAALQNPDQHSKFEKYARLFAQLYQLTSDQKYQRKAALILYYQALDYPRIVVNHNYTDFWGGNYQFPQDAVYTYGSLINSDIWGQIVPGISAAEVKQTIEGFWLSPDAYECLRLINSMELNNITPYGGRSAVVTGMLLNDPEMIRAVISTYDQLFTGKFYFSDGMWNEETTAYGDQVAGNTNSTLAALKDWTDPQGYVDSKLGLSLNHTDLSSRWPLLKQTQNFGSVQMVYPDGTPIPINDTYGKLGSPQPQPITSVGLKNIELPGLGYYGLFQGDQTEATHAGLLFQPTDLGFSGSHTHTNFLSLDLWGAGVEMLPYTGYVHPTYEDGNQTLRYPSMRPLWRNMPWVWRQDGANTVSTGAWEKPALLAYDPGTANGQQVQLVEASDPGANDAAMKRRMVMLVNLGGNRNYTFDLTRLQGGQAHEIFERGPELEGMDVQMQGIQLAATGKSNLQNYLTSINSTTGLLSDMNQLLNPQAGSGDNSFSYTWTGQQTGSTIHTFMNGVSGSDVFLSSIPRERAVTTKADEPNVVAPHLVRRNIVSDSSQITQFGAVHEMFRQGQTGKITNVEWLKPADNDPMTNVAVVTSDNYVDMIYTSGDTTERTFKGITFAGSVAVARIDAATGKLVYSYVYGPGKVTEQNASVTGCDTQQLAITAATTASINPALDPVVRDNTITVTGQVYNKDLYTGKWIQIRFGDGSGYGAKVKDMTEIGNSTVITLEQYTPFSLTGTGVQLLFSPNVSIPGNAYAVFNLPTFSVMTNAATPSSAAAVTVNATAPTITLSGSDSITVYVGSTYTDAGATATDNVDGDVTSSIVTTGTVDTSKEGTYSITYTVHDHAGNTAIATRTVQVINVYKFSGILKPINLDGSSVFQQGSTVPVKFQLTDALNQYVSNLSASIKVTYLS
ncbi:immunoglobulin-like domain-containing protein, partial [Paenibacillus sp. Soil787]|uniref:immunoglobulin-like domain-containing protein n=1 Tax=Paenibacillus sp. Soil787 TaxID=1736411 RepID=UPI0039E1254B